MTVARIYHRVYCDLIVHQIHQATPDPVATMLNREGNDVYATAYHNLSFSPDRKLLAIGQGTGQKVRRTSSKFSSWFGNEGTWLRSGIRDLL